MATLEELIAVSARVDTVSEMLAAWRAGARWCSRASDDDHLRCGRTLKEAIANTVANDGGITVRDMETAERSATEWAEALEITIVREVFCPVTDSVLPSKLNGLIIEDVVLLGNIVARWLKKQ